MHTSEGGIALIKEFEGFPFGGRPYRDSVGVWTIGYGHTEGVGPGSRPITQAQADTLLRHDLAVKYEGAVHPFESRLNQNQFDALVSFAYNLGTGILSSGHTIGVDLRAGNLNAVARDFMLYVYAGGHVLEGLRRRRAAEQHLFLLPSAPVLSHDELKLIAWKKELEEIRAYVHAKGNGWHHHPKRWARAKDLKRVIEKYEKKLNK